MERTYHRWIDLTCPAHRHVDFWPSPDPRALFRQCGDCDTIRRSLFDPHGDLWVKDLDGWSDHLLRQEVAIHEAGHAVIGIHAGRLIERAVATLDPQDGPKGEVRWGAGDQISDLDYLASIWAGRAASLQWLNLIGEDTPANRMDVILNAGLDAIQAQEYAAACGYAPDAGRLRATLLVDRYWSQIAWLADALVVRGQMAGDEVLEVLDEVAALA